MHSSTHRVSRQFLYPAIFLLGSLSGCDCDNGRRPKGVAGALKANVSVADITVTEGNSGNTEAKVNLALDKTALTEIKVRVRAQSASAIEGTDFLPFDQTISIPAGGTTAQVTIQVVGDTTVEPDEVIHIRLSELTGPGKLKTKLARVTILNDDAGITSNVIVFSADYDTANNFDELFTLPAEGGVPTKISNPAVTGGGVARIAVSPDKNKIYFTAQPDGPSSQPANQGFLVNRDGTGLTALEPDSEGFLEGQFSPNGNRLAYVTSTGGVPDRVYVSNSDGTNPIQVSRNLGRDESIIKVEWSPTSNRLAYLISTEGSFDELRAVDVDGSNDSLITDLLIGPNPQTFWSPDGTRLAFVAGEAFAPGVPSLGLTTSDSLGGQKVLLDNLNNGTYTRIEWLRDGSGRIAYSRPVQGGSSGGSLFTQNGTAGNTIAVAGILPDSSEVIDFRIAPDSDNIAYFQRDLTPSVTSDGGIPFQTFLFRAKKNGTSILLLADTISPESAVQSDASEWSPLSTHFAYFFTNGFAAVGVAKIDTANSGKSVSAPEDFSTLNYNLFSSAGNCFSAGKRFSHDGSKVLFLKIIDGFGGGGGGEFTAAPTPDKFVPANLVVNNLAGTNLTSLGPNPNTDFVAHIGVRGATWLEDDSRVIFVPTEVSKGGPNVLQPLYSVKPDGSERKYLIPTYPADRNGINEAVLISIGS